MVPYYWTNVKMASSSYENQGQLLTYILVPQFSLAGILAFLNNPPGCGLNATLAHFDPHGPVSHLLLVGFLQAPIDSILGHVVLVVLVGDLFLVGEFITLVSIDIVVLVLGLTPTQFQLVLHLRILVLP